MINQGPAGGDNLLLKEKEFSRPARLPLALIMGMRGIKKNQPIRITGQKLYV